jgi:glycosyltransferase involved in cell wall biosynthesis
VHYQSRVWPQFDRLQVFTAQDAAFVRRLAPSVANHVSVNPFGVDVPPAVRGDQDDERSIVFVGGFLHPPNVDAARWLAGEILPQVRVAHPRARLLIVGADPPPAVLRLASDAVVVTGRVPAVEPFLESAAVVAAPVRTGGGMRRKVLHAMALARPVVTTTRGAHGVWNPAATPTMLIADDAAGIARHIVSLLDSPELRRTLGMHARAAVIAHHQRTQFADRVAALYESLRQPGVAA